MRQLVVLFFSILCVLESPAQTIDMKVGGQDFCNFPFKPNKKYPVVARNMPKTATLFITNAEVKRINDTLLTVYFASHSDCWQKIEVYIGSALYQSCNFRMPEDEHFSISFGDFRSCDSIRVSELSALPKLHINSDTAVFEIVRFGVSVLQTRGDYQTPIMNTGASLDPKVFDQLRRFKPNFRVCFERIQAKCNGRIFDLKEGFVMLVKK